MADQRTDNDAAAQKKYDEWHSQLQVDSASDSPWHQMIKERISENELEGKRVLDIGCGRGGFALWLRDRIGSGRVVACDFSPAAISIARQFSELNNIDRIHWQVADIQNLEFPAAEFDVVFSTETIEHVPDPPRAVRELARVLKPGGRLFLTTPNYFSLIGLYRAYRWLRGRPYDEGGQPICQLTMLHRTRAWVRAAGLRIQESTSIGQYLPVPGRPWVEMKWAEHPRFLMKKLGLHSLVVAQKDK